jgi:hypothetical protein
LIPQSVTERQRGVDSDIVPINSWRHLARMKGIHHMRAVFLILVSSTLSQILYAQTNHIHVSVESSVDTTNHAIASVINVWEKYLNSNPDSVYSNPYWTESEQLQYNPFDLVGHTWWNPSLYYNVQHWKSTVLSVSPSGSSFIIRTMFYAFSPKDSGRVTVSSIIHTAARLENGSYKLCNVLPINTRYWHKEQVGSIKFVFPLDHVFNRGLAEHVNRFVDSLTTVWQLKVVPIEYYFADDLDRVSKALGFDYWPAEGNISGRRGFTDVRNRIIYSGGSDEWYPHEFVHVYLIPLFPNAHYYFHEGYATLVGGSQGHDLLWHIRRNYEYLKDHTDVDVLSFKGVDAFVGPAYFIGGLLCKMADEKGGLSLVRKLMTYGPEDEDLYRAIHDLFGVSKEHVNSFLREKLAEYATK